MHTFDILTLREMHFHMETGHLGRAEADDNWRVFQLWTKLIQQSSSLLMARRSTIEIFIIIAR